MVTRAAGQAQLLLEHSLDTKGGLSQTQLEQTVQAFSKTKVKHQTATLRQLKRAVRQLLAKQQAVVTSASQLSTVTQQDIEQHIASQYPTVKVIDWQVDPHLIGGLTVQVGDMWYDASVIHDLQTIREQLAK